MFTTQIVPGLPLGRKKILEPLVAIPLIFADAPTQVESDPEIVTMLPVPVPISRAAVGIFHLAK